MALSVLAPPKPYTRRRFLQGAGLGSLGLAFYSCEIARHWIDVVQLHVPVRGLPPAFDGMRIVQISDLHMDEFTEPFFLRMVVSRINQLQPDAVFLTGDFVTAGLGSKKYAAGAAWQCAGLLHELQCRALYAVLGNHDVILGRKLVVTPLTANGIKVLDNAYLPIERGGSRIWLAGLDDPTVGAPNLARTLPPAICNRPEEPILLLCHAPDYADTVLKHPAGQSVALMLSGHTHGGQIRLPLLGALDLPLLGALDLPPLGQKYVQGLFHLDRMQLYVNRGIGTVGLPFRLNCPPEITLHTLHRA